MNSLLDLGIVFVLWLQSLGLSLLAPMVVFTSLGYEQFYMLVAPVLFWCIEPALGLRVGLGVMFSGALNGILKLAFHAPRPYWYDARVVPLSNEINFGAPSAHAQNALVFWGLVAHWVRKAWFWVVALLLILLISLSRVYLGMHFPTDVLIGWLVGLLVVWLTIALEKPALSWLKRRPVGVQILAAFAVSLGAILIGALVRLALNGWSVPSGWLELSSRAGEINPLALSGVITPAASFFGLACGAILLHQGGWLDPHGTLGQQVARYLIGILGVFLIWYGLDMLFPPGESLVPYIFRFVRYGLVGFWVTCLAPLIFIRLKLAQRAFDPGGA